MIAADRIRFNTKIIYRLLGLWYWLDSTIMELLGYTTRYFVSWNVTVDGVIYWFHKEIRVYGKICTSHGLIDMLKKEMEIKIEQGVADKELINGTIVVTYIAKFPL